MPPSAKRRRDFFNHRVHRGRREVLAIVNNALTPRFYFYGVGGVEILACYQRANNRNL